MISAPVIEYSKKGIFTILGLMLAVYLFVILMTYTGNDPSWSHISSDMTTINNMGGAMGAWFADLLYSFFGYGAWWLLVFMVYESILIWWESKPTFWLLRLVAYVFLILSGSALIAQLITIVQQVTTPSLAGSTGIAGGIIGHELQARLSQLLTQWGSVAFLSVFLLITATFAFNIHWRLLYQKLVNLEWLGSGVKADNRSIKLTDIENANSEADEVEQPQIKSGRAKPDYVQLPLELQSDEHSSVATEDTSGRFNHVLTEFLSKTGLGATVKAAIVKDAVESDIEFEQGLDEEISSNAAMPTMPTTSQKVEPSFAWNDSGMVDDLLASEIVPQQVKTANDPSTTTIKTAKVEPTATNERAVDNTQFSSVDNDKTVANETASIASDLDKLAATWLTAHDDGENTSAQQEQAANDALQAAVLDMTPTNTPPANPKEAPTATVSRPTISFAVPDGDSSNHIADMMPENDAHAPTMPEIHDDAAFSKSSRSMQTAKYRSQLTPIPELSILDKPDPNRQPSYTIAELEQLSELLEIKLQEFNVKASVVNAIPGPVVTRFEVELAPGIKASKVTGISRDLARSLSMASLRVVEVIPGKPYIGIEVPNKQREMVRLIELLNTEKFNDPKAQISMAMGKDIGGRPIITDLARAPHMLVAGTTGSGKSVLVNSMLLSMLLKYTPNELRLILIDPKQLELANYNDIPHLLTPVVTDMTEAASALSWCVAEMERRYQLMSLLKVRKLNEFNKKVIAAEKSGNPMLDPLWRPNDNVSIDQAPKLKTLPMIVIVADEFADMIMQVGKQAEELITRLAQKSRAAGIHLMLATQRPSVDVITGLIKANIPVRAALRVNSKVDSRTILDSGGAEDMLGNGDMLFLGPGQIEPDRVHGAYVSDEEVNRVCDAWRERGAPDYIDNMAGNFELSSSTNGGSAGIPSGEDDDLYNEAVGFIMETRKVSASSIQRKFSIGYNRAARIVDSMEEAGLVSSMGKSGKRELLM